MDRRHFLKTSVPAVAALSFGITGCNDSTSEPPPLPGDTQFPPITFITADPDFYDYRPAIDATGTRVVFERLPFPDTNHADIVLYVATSIDLPNPPVAPFVPRLAVLPASYPPSQSRPDWCWKTHEVVFSGAASQTSPIDAYIVSADGTALSIVPNTREHIYPIWSSNGTELVIYNNTPSALRVHPVTSLITSDGAVVVGNLNGTDESTPPGPVFGGFAAPLPGFPRQIAFAGQPALASWGVPSGQVPPLTAEYNQDNNYVFLNAEANLVFTSRPLESKASLQAFDPAYQGRAPYWSPDGKYIVFESSRAGGYALFLANVADVANGAPPVQLTDPSYWAQHAKFFPDGTRLVFTALLTPDLQKGSGARGIAVIDISAYLS
jgi:hypothetical protein